MVATNILSLYHLSSTIQSTQPAPPPVPDHLIHQLSTIRATINHLTSLQPTTPPTNKVPSSSSTPSDLLLYTHIAPIASSCKDHPLLLHQYMNYTPFALCPNDSPLAEDLILRGCHPPSPPPLLFENHLHYPILTSHKPICHTPGKHSFIRALQLQDFLLLCKYEI
ncbi:S-adenosyl-L-methionine-dependent methyltransferase superfamily protein [Abeliophyllum distichum]|uniref:S-adenosyl-L-methionine-dependent methyltransferase superfamily protein n=1 Tax=Abeliophyllum distichum TaxID=126358 RepID=A0ABD1QFR9_9LAMI